MTTHSIRCAALALVAAPLLFAAPSAAQEEAQTLFVDTYKCNMCHSVESAGVEAKSEKTFSGDLGGFTTDDPEALARYLRKEEPRDGEDHKKTYAGSDEELQAILDWLSSLEPVAEG
jgi:hypothetical protein